MLRSGLLVLVVSEDSSFWCWLYVWTHCPVLQSDTLICEENRVVKYYSPPVSVIHSYDWLNDHIFTALLSIFINTSPLFMKDSPLLPVWHWMLIVRCWITHYGHSSSDTDLHKALSKLIFLFLLFTPSTVFHLLCPRPHSHFSPVCMCSLPTYLTCYIPFCCSLCHVSLCLCSIIIRCPDSVVMPTIMSDTADHHYRQKQ